MRNEYRITLSLEIYGMTIELIIIGLVNSK
jgi:hypothetical protein